MTLSSHRKRILTGVLLLAFVAFTLWMGGWLLRAVILLVSSLALYEFLTMYWPAKVYLGRKILGLLLGALVVLSQYVDALWTLAAVCLCFMIIGMIFLYEFGSGKGEARLGHYSPILHGLFYIPLALQLAFYLSPAEQCLILLAAVASDTGGYYGGSWFGKRKLWPAVSPKKTWAGFYGGMLLCVLLCLFMGLLTLSFDLRMLRIPIWGWIFIGLVLHQAALFGDLFESAVKRTLNIKDSGTLLPGHGGVLDRIDSLLFVLPAYMILKLLVRILQGS